MLNKGYLVFGAIILVLYGVVGLTGWEFATPPRQRLSPDVRHTSGGHHSSSSGYSGFRGGK